MKYVKNFEHYIPESMRPQSKKTSTLYNTIVDFIRNKADELGTNEDNILIGLSYNDDWTNRLTIYDNKGNELTHIKNNEL
jgi:hypothetical protein